MNKRFTEEKIVAILREAETGSKSIEELAREHRVSEPTVYFWRSKYGSMEPFEARRVRELEQEISRLKEMLAKRELQLKTVTELLQTR